MIKMLQYPVKNDALTLVAVGAGADIQHNETHNPYTCVCKV